MHSDSVFLMRVGPMNGRTNGQTDRQTNEPTTDTLSNREMMHLAISKCSSRSKKTHEWNVFWL